MCGVNQPSSWGLGDDQVALEEDEAVQRGLGPVVASRVGFDRATSVNLRVGVQLVLLLPS